MAPRPGLRPLPASRRPAPEPPRRRRRSGPSRRRARRPSIEYACAPPRWFRPSMTPERSCQEIAPRGNGAVPWRTSPVGPRPGAVRRGRDRDRSSVLEIRSGGLELVLAKPQTYMNDSGSAVRRLLQSYHVPLVDLLVIADDFALPFGKLRFREAGTHGGHNGLRSIIAELNSEKFSRLRVGIGEPGRGAVDHVLSRFSEDERARLSILLDASAEAVETWARQGTSKAANRFNAWDMQAPAAASDDEAAPKPGE